ncbi:hypothetical protein OUZ56_021354 [Daphnia magna]|uniref:Uncharacterized protein n=1 Tax=Daphnia magna TaxID=35525 RepID=A0ABQ9ZH41_9CRUS|nr:hypothetical protein OUZ56_021354 [Daphnia magna]
MHSSVVGQFPDLPPPPPPSSSSSFLTSWFLRLARRATSNLWCACAPCFLTQLLVCDGQLQGSFVLQPSPSRWQEPSRAALSERLHLSRRPSTCYTTYCASTRLFLVPLQLALLWTLLLKPN